MKLDPKLRHMSEEEILETIDRVVSSLSPGFAFGIFDVDDLKQEGTVIALEALAPGTKYDPTRPLDKFLYSHIRFRFLNLRRKNLKRTDSPCKLCPFWPGPKNPEGCNAFEDRHECDKWSAFTSRNRAKVNIAQPITLDVVRMDEEDNMFYDSLSHDNMCRKEVINIINEELSPTLRGDFLRFLDGAKLAKGRKDRIVEEILSILYRYDLYEAEDG